MNEEDMSAQEQLTSITVEKINIDLNTLLSL